VDHSDHRFDRSSLSLSPALGDPGAESAGVSITFVTPDGIPFANSPIIIYQWPFDPPRSFVPPVLASGTTDASGVFSSQLSARDVTGVQGSWGDGQATLVNAIVKAIDPTNRWMVRYDVVLPLDAFYSDTLTANIDLAAAWPEGATLRRSTEGRELLEIAQIHLIRQTRCKDRVRCPRPTTIVGETTREVKVLEMHVGAGMRGTFTYSAGQATYGETAVKVGTSSWNVRGDDPGGDGPGCFGFGRQRRRLPPIAIR